MQKNKNLNNNKNPRQRIKNIVSAKRWRESETRHLQRLLIEIGEEKKEREVREEKRCVSMVMGLIDRLLSGWQ